MTGTVSAFDEKRGLGEAELDERDEAVAAGQELGLALAVSEDLERLVQVRRTDVIELSRNHRATVLLARPYRAAVPGLRA